MLERAIVLMGCAIGAGLALIAGIGPGIGEVTPQVRPSRPSPASRK